MNRRTSFGLFSFAFALTCAGCVTTTTKEAAPIAAQGTALTTDTPTVAKRPDGPRRAAQPKTEIAFGVLKETEAESDAAKQHPETQAKLRDEARRAYQAALRQDSNNLEAYRRLATLYTKIGDYERAFTTFKEAMAKHPKNAPLWYELGMCHHRRKELNESVKCLQKALEIDPENREYLKKLGFTVAYLGHIDQGLALLTRAQGAALAHYGIARILIQKDQVPQAQHHLQIALRENSQLEEARELLASLADPNANARDNRAAGNLRAARE